MRQWCSCCRCLAMVARGRGRGVDGSWLPMSSAFGPPNTKQPTSLIFHTRPPVCRPPHINTRAYLRSCWRIAILCLLKARPSYALARMRGHHTQVHRRRLFSFVHQAIPAPLHEPHTDHPTPSWQVAGVPTDDQVSSGEVSL
jgi:hypothetical protein